MVPNRPDHCQEIGPSLHQGRAVFRRDPANGNRWDFKHLPPPGQDFRRGTMDGFLAFSREEGTKGNIIRPRFAASMARWRDAWQVMPRMRPSNTRRAAVWSPSPWPRCAPSQPSLSASVALSFKRNATSRAAAMGMRISTARAISSSVASFRRNCRQATSPASSAAVSGTRNALGSSR